MQAAAARARRLLALPAASGIPGILSGPIPGRASYAEGVLLYRLNGAPASPSSPQHTRGFSSSCFASRSHCNLPSPTIASQWLNEKSVHYHMTTAHFSTEASDMDHPTEAMVCKGFQCVSG
uniref:Uncharacterized protein n=1 Tax=Zea mays TaxID=4577 RepID=B6U909_MAIZE|nr:hypothetical protein [Zea mays]